MNSIGENKTETWIRKYVAKHVKQVMGISRAKLSNPEQPLMDPLLVCPPFSTPPLQQLGGFNYISQVWLFLPLPGLMWEMLIFHGILSVQ